MQLRSYQQQAVSDLREVFRLGYRSALFVLPTGGGKTVVFAEIARSATALGKRVLVLTHRSELLNQAHAKLTGLSIDVGIVYRKHRYQHTRLVHVSSVQTMARVPRLRLFDPGTFDLIIIDEAHHAPAADWSRVLDYFDKARLLGVTATPIRSDGRGLRDQFQVMVKGPTPEWLTDAGFLAPARVFAPPVGFDPAKIKRRLLGDFDPEGCEQQLIGKVVLGDVVGHYRKHLDGRTAIAFCVSVDHAQAVAAEFMAHGIEAASIDGSLKQEDRESLLRRLATGDLKVLTSCDLIGEGVDVPSVAGCILLRPTQSLGLFLQMVGRALRPKTDGSEAIVLDHVGNYERHGHHLDDRPWSLDGVDGAPKNKRQGEKAASVWVCPKCFATNRSTSLTCIDCGSDKPDERGGIHQEAGHLRELEHSRQMRLTAAIERQEKKKRRREQGAARSLSELIEVGRRRGMKYPYAWAKKVLASRKHRRP